ncbi:unnamed protein product [Cylicostephanus goldi]|uniref:Serine/threonine specific protein phosphatases domain-containing protein n=1 Tax=Cylicostephanus goldi TaxID=71465 RepID=A0A3P6RXF5_CYLGO|nr:unnamed protein product [Cylicostephanus goldi]
MHGGLSPELSHLDVIRNIPRPCEPLDRGLLIDLTWSDPTNKGEGWFHSIRGISYMFGKGVVQQACQMLGIDLIIRAHQVVQDGYEMMAGRKLITVFSAPNYCGQFTNAAAIVCLDEDLQITFQQMKMQIPANLAPKARTAPAIACDTNPTNAKADKEFIKPFTVCYKSTCLVVCNIIQPGFKSKGASTTKTEEKEKPKTEEKEKTKTEDKEKSMKTARMPVVEQATEEKPKTETAPAPSSNAPTSSVPPGPDANESNDKKEEQVTFTLDKSADGR